MRKCLPIVLLALSLLPVHLSGQDEGSGKEPVDRRQEAGMVYVDGFYIDIYEFPNHQGAVPKVDVSWEEAKTLCQERGKRLCSEQEWQQACAGSENYPYGYGPVFSPERCNTPYLENGVWKRDRGLAPSGAFAGCTNDYGVHDMIGNVWEWTASRHSGPENWRIVRGGSWFHNVNLARADARYGRYLTPDYRLDLIGFRCCRSAAGPEDSTE